MVEYLLDVPQAPDESIEQLHEYHPSIEEIIGETIDGLTGVSNTIHRVVVDEELSDTERADLETYLGSSLSKVES